MDNVQVRHRVSVTKQCPICEKTHTIEVDAEAWDRWQRREVNIQDAFPELSADVREMLNTGIDGACWDTMFEKGEGDDGWGW